MVTKNCSRSDCQEQNPQPETNFVRHKRLRSGRKSECKSCTKRYMQQRYWSDPERFRKVSRDYNENNPDKVRLHRNPLYAHKAPHCASCGFVALDPCQLDLDHIDGNNKNNELSNLQTLCANCHRLKTKLNRDNLSRYQLKAVK
jgi:5-methylcytosine-specific restriction endonuclease McrA